MRDIRTGLLLVLLVASVGAQAEPKPGDHSAPVFHHTPMPSAVQGADVTISSQIEDESDVFAPILWWRYAGADTFQSVDLVKKGDVYVATVPANQPIEYWLEAYDELGNGPARAGSPERPFKIEITSRPPLMKDGAAPPTRVAPEPAVAPIVAPPVTAPAESAAPSIAVAPAEPAGSSAPPVVVAAPTEAEPPATTGGPAIAVAPTAAPTDAPPVGSGPSIAVAPAERAPATEPSSVAATPGGTTPEPGAATPGEPAPDSTPPPRSSSIAIAPTEAPPPAATAHTAPAEPKAEVTPSSAAAEPKVDGTAKPSGELDLNAPTPDEKAAAEAKLKPPVDDGPPPPPVYKRWWFVSGSAVVAAGIVTGIVIYALRPAPIHEIEFPASVKTE